MVSAQKKYHIALVLALGLFSACSDGVSPEGAYPFAGRDYLWDAGISTRYYRVFRTGKEFRHTITISGSGIVDDTQTDGQAGVLARTKWNFSQANGRLSGCGDRTLWHLPPELRASEQVFTAPGPTVVSSSFLGLDASNLIVGTLSDGLFHYNTPRGEWYSMSFPVQDEITVLCKDSTAGNAMIFAATASSGVYCKARYDSTWTKLPVPAGRIADLEVSGNDVLFAVIEGTIWFSPRPFDAWVPFRVAPGDGQINDIAILPLLPTEEVLFAATKSMGVTYIQLVHSIPAQFGFSEQSGFENVRQLSTAPEAPYIAVGIGDPPMLFVAPESGVWIGIPVSTSATLTCVAQSRKNGTVLIGSDDGIYRFVGSLPMRSGLQGRRIRTLNAGLDGAFYAGADDGFFRSNDEGVTWTRIDGATVLMRVTTPWQLLPGRFKVGSAWQAATLLRPDESSLILTGRVLHHFHEIVLPDGFGRYEDAVVVRYAEENPSGGVQHNEYVWTAYYVRGKGLVYIEESRGGTLLGSSHLVDG